MIDEGFDLAISIANLEDSSLAARKLAPNRRVICASPDYLHTHGTPQTPQDLTDHVCINLHLTTLGGRYPWEFERNGREIKVRVEGQLVFNSLSTHLALQLSSSDSTLVFMWA